MNDDCRGTGILPVRHSIRKHGLEGLATMSLDVFHFALKVGEWQARPDSRAGARNASAGRRLPLADFC
jgi:hypothetical protein